VDSTVVASRARLEPSNFGTPRLVCEIIKCSRARATEAEDRLARNRTMACARLVAVYASLPIGSRPTEQVARASNWMVVGARSAER